MPKYCMFVCLFLFSFSFSTYSKETINEKLSRAIVDNITGSEHTGKWTAYEMTATWSNHRDKEEKEKYISINFYRTKKGWVVFNFTVGLYKSGNLIVQGIDLKISNFSKIFIEKKWKNILQKENKNIKDSFDKKVEKIIDALKKQGKDKK